MPAAACEPRPAPPPPRLPRAYCTADPGPAVVLPLADYEQLSAYLQRMGRMLRTTCLSSAGAIPPRTLQAARRVPSTQQAVCVCANIQGITS